MSQGSSVPSGLLISAYYVRKWYLARRLRIHGIGKGGEYLFGVLSLAMLIVPIYRDYTLTGTAPGFQTSVKKLRVTPEIAARIRRGEVVSPEEIDAAARKADLKSAAEGSGSGLAGLRVIEERDDRHLINAGNKEEEVVNEWLPESVSKPSRRKKGRK